MARIPFLLFLFGLMASMVAASAPTFCKCTCFQNSTIIPLGPQRPGGGGGSVPNAPPPPAATGTSEATPPAAVPLKRAASSSCSQCNRAFCLQYNLPICEGAEETDVVTMCFQRDSRKDQIIVWAFILGTLGLLAWAGAQRVMELREQRKSHPGLSAGNGRLPGSGGAGGGGGGLGGLASRMGSAFGGVRSPRDEAGRGAYSPLEGETTHRGMG